MFELLDVADKIQDAQLHLNFRYQYVVYLKFKFNWAVCISSGNSNIYKYNVNFIYYI